MKQKVCYFGTYRAEYSRNRILIEGLRRNGVQVIECHQPLWQSIEDRVNSVSGGWKRPRFWWRVLRTYIRLLIAYWRLGSDYDVMIVGYPGQFDVYLARLLSWWHGKPLVWDIFMSIYLIALERGLDRENRAIVGLIRRFERWACHLPDRLVLDTKQYVAWFGQTHGIHRDRFCLVPTGADSDLFRPPPTGSFADKATTVTINQADSNCFRILYYGTFIPNHGVTTMIEAAQLLRDDASICFEFIGEGPEQATVMKWAEAQGLRNVCFVSWLEQRQLIERIAAADLCLGAFGNTPQSLMTVQNKIYECLAMQKAVLSGDSASVREKLMHGKHIYLCERGNPQALATAVKVLQQDANLRQLLGRQGRQLFEAEFTIERLGKRFCEHLQALY